MSLELRPADIDPAAATKDRRCRNPRCRKDVPQGIAFCTVCMKKLPRGKQIEFLNPSTTKERREELIGECVADLALPIAIPAQETGTLEEEVLDEIAYIEKRLTALRRKIEQRVRPERASVRAPAR